MLAVFLNAVLPVFTAAALGFAFCRAGLFDSSMATAINRFVFYAALPVLLFRLIATAPFEQFEWTLVLAYGVAEIALYATGFAVARFGFRRSRTESLLLGMSASFANHAFFVLPIARQVYGEAGAMPVVAVITLDSVVLFGGTVLILEATSEAARGLSPLHLVGLFARNPQILAIAAAVAATLASAPLGGGVDVFTRFPGDAAAPCSLFALGVILAARTSTARFAPASVFAALKLLGMPLAMGLLLSTVFPVSAEWTGAAMLVAAGPTGAMPFILGLQYKAPVDTIAPTILITTLGSLFTVTLVTQLL